MDTTQKKEIPQPALQILKETAEQFRLLNQEGEAILFGGDSKMGKEKFRQGAQLLVDLPDRLINLLGKVDLQKRDRLIEGIEWFRRSAKKALEKDSDYALSGLLSDRGQQVGDQNDLEELIAFLEK